MAKNGCILYSILDSMNFGKQNVKICIFKNAGNFSWSIRSRPFTGKILNKLNCIYFIIKLDKLKKNILNVLYFLPAGEEFKRTDWIMAGL